MTVPPSVSAAILCGALLLVNQPVLSQGPEGFWESDGYGLLVEIDSTTLQVFQTTSISCIPWWTAQRVASERDSNEVVFNRGDARIRLTPGSTPDVLLMREGPSISRVTLRRVGGRPERCNQPPADTPIDNYTVFWQTWAEQFALFELYHTNWQAVDGGSTDSPEWHS